MLEFFTSTPKEDAIAILKADHDKVKALFDQFDAADNLRDKKRIASEAIMELKIHAEIEEKIFYPAVREDVEEDLMYEADEEHHVAKLLIAELDQMNGTEDHWEAKFTVLAENIRHHIKEEEGEMLPQARKSDVDFVSIGQKLLAMKQQLKKNGVPVSDEEILMSGTRGKADSSARNAKLKKPVSVKARPAATSKRAATKNTASKTRRTSAATPSKAKTGKAARTKSVASRPAKKNSAAKRPAAQRGKSSARRRG